MGNDENCFHRLTAEYVGLDAMSMFNGEYNLRWSELAKKEQPLKLEYLRRPREYCPELLAQVQPVARGGTNRKRAAQPK